MSSIKAGGFLDPWGPQTAPYLEDCFCSADQADTAKQLSPQVPRLKLLESQAAYF